jgi:hypothetical protein
MTLPDWNSTGFRVKKGQTASGTNGHGEATFTRDQVFSKDDPGSEHAPLSKED